MKDINSITEDIKIRIAAENRGYCAITTTLKSRIMNKISKLKVYKTMQ